MRPLTDDETKIFFEKLSKYIGRNIKHLIDRTDEEYCFRLHKDRVYYVSDAIVRRASNVEKKLLVSLGTCFGKFTKSLKFRLHITALDYLAQYAKYKVWVRPSSELSFLYGNNVLKAGLGRITENTPEHQGVVVYSMSDIPLGFGVTAKSTADCRRLNPTDVVVYHQADVGEYLREEDTLYATAGGPSRVSEVEADNRVVRKRLRTAKPQARGGAGGGRGRGQPAKASGGKAGGEGGRAKKPRTH